MPYHTIWTPNPHDKSLPVLKDEDLPAGVYDLGLTGFFGGHTREKHGTIDGEYVRFHYCPHCGGWIPGDYYTYQVNNLNTRALAGRSDECSACRRCGEEVGFTGLMS
jgi:hypothetical protein